MKLILILSSLFVALVAVLVASPGIFFINQELQIIPTRHSYYVEKFYGLPLSNQSLIVASLSIAFGLALFALLLFGIAVASEAKEDEQSRED